MIKVPGRENNSIFSGRIWIDCMIMAAILFIIFSAAWEQTRRVA